MSITIKSGSISDFFASARETAKEIDEERKITPKNIIWVEPNDLRALLKPERTNLVKFLRHNKRVIFSELMQAMGRTPASLNNDLEILAKYQLVRIFREPNPGHGMRKVIESTFADECIQVIAEF
ncbi:MAG: transcriptional regulator [Aquificales bacterium]|nr:transcriptional regulator [Aquificales bacterium]